MRDLRFYFAYGSNMAPSRMEDRGIKSKVFGVGYLDHYGFMLNKISKKDPSIGFANVVPCWNKRVYGVVYDLGNGYKDGPSSDPVVSKDITDNIAILDKFEGYPFHYERTNIPVRVEIEGKFRSIIAFTYIAGLEKQASSNLLIEEEYASKITEGLDSHAINEEYKREIKELMGIWKK